MSGADKEVFAIAPLKKCVLHKVAFMLHVLLRTQIKAWRIFFLSTKTIIFSPSMNGRCVFRRMARLRRVRETISKSAKAKQGEQNFALSLPIQLPRGWLSLFPHPMLGQEIFLNTPTPEKKCAHAEKNRGNRILGRALTESQLLSSPFSPDSRFHTFFFFCKRGFFPLTVLWTV